MKGGFPKKQSKLHDPIHAVKGMSTPTERHKNSQNNKLRMFSNRIHRWRVRKGYGFMKCVKHKKTGQVRRVSDTLAHAMVYVEGGWGYCPKHVYRNYLKDKKKK